jgi:Zn-dependent protease
LKDKNALWSIFLILYFGPFLFITILIHEFGHIVMTKALGGEVLGLVLWPLGGGGGGYALCGTTDKGPCGNLKVALAGPLTQFPQGAIWYGFYVLAAGGKHCFSYFVFPRRVERELLYLQCFSATQLLRMLIYLFLTCYRLIHLMEGGASVPSF